MYSVACYPILLAVSSTILIVCCITAALPFSDRASFRNKQAHTVPLNASVLKLLLFGAFLILLATATQTQAELVYAGWNYGPPPGSGLNFSPQDFLLEVSGVSDNHNGLVVAPGMIAAAINILCALFALLNKAKMTKLPDLSDERRRPAS